MTVRAKLVLTSRTDHYGAPNMKTLRFEARYDEAIPEDQRFCEATPSGHLEMLVTNPAALEQLELGEAYYVDLTKVPKED